MKTNFYSHARKTLTRFQNMWYSVIVWKTYKRLITKSLVFGRDRAALEHHLWGEISIHWAHLSVYCVPGFQCFLLHWMLVMCTVREGSRRVVSVSNQLAIDESGFGKQWARGTRLLSDASALNKRALKLNRGVGWSLAGVAGLSSAQFSISPFSLSLHFLILSPFPFNFLIRPYFPLFLDPFPALVHSF